MREQILADFFVGRATAAELAADLAGAEERSAERTSIVRIEDMAGELTVTREMLMALCDAVLTKSLEPGVLETVGFALMASDRFTWDGEQTLGDVIADWSCPELTIR